jgi:glutamyl-tRNA reductase
VDPRARLIAVGLSHRTAAIAQRERAALGEGAARAALRALIAGGAVSEAAVLGTCNRTELYAATAEDADAGLPGVALYDLDRLGAVAAANREARSREAVAAQAIVDADVARYLAGAGRFPRRAIALLEAA